MRYRLLIAGLCVLLVASLVPGLAVPGQAVPGRVSAQSTGIVTVRLWQGESPRPARYIIGQTTGIRLLYTWFAATDAQVQDFIAQSPLTITLDDEPLFVSPEAASMWWQPSEPFTLGGQSLRRASWVFEIAALPPGMHTFKTTISLAAAVSDGVSAAPFGPGVVTETTQVILVVGAGYALPVGVVQPATPVQPVVPTAVPVVVVPPAQPTPVPVQPVIPTAIPQATPVPPPAPQEQWITREQSYGGRVVGTLLGEAQAYWYPAENMFVDPPITFHTGQTLWVYGLDPTRQFYMVIIDEAYVWVKAYLLGPTNDAVWQGRELPTVIINPNS